jgi:hypothetical protein
MPSDVSMARTAAPPAFRTHIGPHRYEIHHASHRRLDVDSLDATDLFDPRMVLSALQERQLALYHSEELRWDGRGANQGSVSKASIDLGAEDTLGVIHTPPDSQA